jgi:hypothetical protein
LRIDRTCVGPTSARPRRSRCRTTRRVKDSAGVSSSTRGDIIVDDITADDTFDDTATAVYDATVTDTTRGDTAADDTAADDTAVNDTAADDVTRGDNGDTTVDDATRGDNGDTTVDDATRGDNGATYSSTGRSRGTTHWSPKQAMKDHTVGKERLDIQARHGRTRGIHSALAASRRQTANAQAVEDVHRQALLAPPQRDDV